MDSAGTYLARQSEDRLRAVAPPQHEVAAEAAEIGGEALQAMMQPPAAGAAGFPGARCAIVEDEHRDDRRFASDSSGEGGMIGEAQVAPEPEDDGLIGHEVFWFFFSKKNKRVFLKKEAKTFI
jgi:hypothetical protein